MKTTAGNAWKGFAASLLLHLAVAAFVLGGITLAPATKLPVIDLSLLPPLADGGADAFHGPAAGSSRGPGRNPAPAAGASIAPISARPEFREDASPEPDPAASLSAASSPAEPASAASVEAAFSPAAASPHASSRDSLLPGTGSGPGPLSARASAPGVGASPTPGYGYLREAIQREISYPSVARRMGWEGRVVVAFVILPDGGVRDVRVVRGSGFALLDRNAVEAVRSASPFPHPPAEAEILTPVVYKLD